MAGFAVKKSTGEMCSSIISTGLLTSVLYVRAGDYLTKMDSHDRPVFDSRIVCEAETAPQHHILLQKIVIARHHVGDAACLPLAG